MKKLLLLLCILNTGLILAQHQDLPGNQYSREFQKAYQEHPDIPKGILEAIAFTNTRIEHILNPDESCMGLPAVYGVMGLTLDGRGYFRNNLLLISELSGISPELIMRDPGLNILAYASAYDKLLEKGNHDITQFEAHIPILVTLSELPNYELMHDFALNTQLYAVLNFLLDPIMQDSFNFHEPDINLEQVFGTKNYQVLSSNFIRIQNEIISTKDGNIYTNSDISENRSSDYPPAIWNPTSCNYNSRAGTPISAVTIHTVQGSYASCIAWFKNCDSNVSTHYVMRSSDGQVTQMVREYNKGWHVGTENPYTIGIEHEGYVDNPAWYTQEMYESSSHLIRDIVNSGYGINPLRTAYFPWAATTHYNVDFMPGNCIKIKGHQHYPNQTHTDPGANWNWDYYYKLINDSTKTDTLTQSTGNIIDSGGTSGEYGNDERQLFLIQPEDATSIVLNINEFDIEDEWDYLYFYDGSTVFDPLIGVFTGTDIPSTISSSGTSLLIEFRTDCLVSYPGFDLSYSTILTKVPEIHSSYKITVFPNPFHDEISIYFDSMKRAKVNVSLFDLHGKLIFSKLVNDKSIRINTGDYQLQSGMYFLSLVSETTSRTFKIIK